MSAHHAPPAPAPTKERVRPQSLAQLNVDTCHTGPLGSALTLRQCNAILKSLKRNQGAQYFLEPVDHVALNIPDYPRIVTKPMDFGTIDRRLAENRYQNAERFVADVRLVISNACLFNPKGHVIHNMAKSLEHEFEKLLSKASAAATPNTPSSAKPKSMSVTAVCKPIINSLRQHALAAPFKAPVDWKKMQLHTYPDVVKRPMDLGSILKKLDDGAYREVAQVKEDVDLIWENCYKFNGVDSWIAKNANALREMAHKKFDRLRAQVVGSDGAGDGGAGDGDHHNNHGHHSHHHSNHHGGGGGSRSSSAPPPGNTQVAGIIGMITPEMRIQLYENCKMLSESDRSKVHQMALESCPPAVHKTNDELVIDLNLLDNQNFLKLDVFVRRIVAGNSSTIPM